MKYDRDHDPLAALVAVLAPALRELVRAEVRAALPGAARDDELIPHVSWPTGRSRRGNAALGRSGAIAGATRVGKTWLASRSAIAAWIAQHGAPPPPVVAPEGGGIDLAAEALAIAANRRPRRAADDAPPSGRRARGV
jgi:hypothetical protein